MGRILPILFNTEMVQAIINGKKSVTRRICKDANEYSVPDMDFLDVEKRTYAVHCYSDVEHTYNNKLSLAEHTCPICPGDILYVRETWAFIPCIDCMCDDEGNCLCNKDPVTYEDKYSVSQGCFVYRADCTEEDKGCLVWRPSIHMPKQAARIWLKVTDVQVERLQDITEQQTETEGIYWYDCPAGYTWKPEPDMYNCYTNPVAAMAALWNRTLLKDQKELYGWDVNPWVWVIEFERCEKPESEE